MTIEQLKELRDRESALRSYLAIDERLEKIANDKALSVSDGFWEDNKRATEIIKEINKNEYWVKLYQQTKDAIDDFAILFEC
jgi:peptide chain release factor 2